LKKTIEIGLMIIIISRIDINLILQEFNKLALDKIINGKMDNKDKQMKITIEWVNLIDLKNQKVTEELVI
jgi:hypothetical protein